MPSIFLDEASKRLAVVVERAKPSFLAEIFAELFPGQPPVPSPSGSELGRHVREELAPEEIVDLWNVVFPTDRNVWYDEETHSLHVNEEMAGYPD